MLEVIRENKGRWVLKVVLAVIALAFVFTFGNMNTSAMNGYAVKVNGEEVPFERFQIAFENALQRRQNRMLPDDLTEKLVINEVLDSLIEEELLRQFADEVGIHVSKAEVADSVKQTFQENGAFIGKARYLELLEQNGRDVVDFEEDVRKGLVVDKARKFVEGSVKVSPEAIREEWQTRNEKVNLEFVLVDASSLAESVKKDPVTDKELLDFEMQFPGLAETLYQEEKLDRWTEPARAKLKQITVRKPAAGKGDAASAKRRSARALETAATDWAKAAEQFSEGPAWEKSGEAREMIRSELPAAVADKVFSMNPEDPAALVETPTSFAIVKVESTTPEKVTELDEKVKNEILAEQIRQKRAEALVESFTNEAFAKLKSGQSLEKIAASRGLAVKESGPFTRRQAIPGVPQADDALTAAAFQLEKAGSVLEVNGAAPKLGGGAYLLAVLKEHTRPDETKYETDKVWVQSSLQRVRSMEAFRSWKALRTAEAKIVQNPQILPPDEPNS